MMKLSYQIPIADFVTSCMPNVLLADSTVVPTNEPFSDGPVIGDLDF